MAEEKRDYLGLCNETKIPFQDFITRFCSRCFQGECSRSLHGKSRFEHRIQNWEGALFTNVVTLDPKDDRYKDISAKRFLPVDPGQANAPSAWLDPREIEPAREIVIPAAQPLVVKNPEPSPQVAPIVPKAEESAPQAPAAAPPQPPPDPVIRNTAVKPRQMIGGAEQKPPPPVLDPWQPKQPLKPDDVLVKPGGRIKLTR